MAWDKVWEEIFQEREWARYPAESLIRFIAKNFYNRDRKKTRILEIGCGPGSNIWYMAREGFTVYGMDGSKTAVLKAKQRIKKDGLRANLKLGDVKKLTYKDNYFDAVIDSECLYSNSGKDTENILAETRRVVKKNGLFYSRTFSDCMDVGSSKKILGDLEYRDISDGPFAGKGLVRLIDKERIKSLYGKFFKIISIDKSTYTYNSGAIKISEWIIICQKK